MGLLTQTPKLSSGTVKTKQCEEQRANTYKNQSVKQLFLLLVLKKRFEACVSCFTVHHSHVWCDENC